VTPDGLSAEALRKSLEGIPSTLQGMRSPMGEHSRSESVAGMDMLNDMFQRQARRLESQLYQRAQDQRTIEVAQRQAQLAMVKVRQLEQHHLEQQARVQHGVQSLHLLQQQMQEVANDHVAALATCEALQWDVAQLRELLLQTNAAALDGVTLRSAKCASVEALRRKAAEREAELRAKERNAVEPIDATPATSAALSDDAQMSANPLEAFSVVADFASKQHVPAALACSPLSDATRSLSSDMLDAHPGARLGAGQS